MGPRRWIGGEGGAQVCSPPHGGCGGGSGSFNSGAGVPTVITGHGVGPGGLP